MLTFDDDDDDDVEDVEDGKPANEQSVLKSNAIVSVLPLWLALLSSGAKYCASSSCCWPCDCCICLSSIRLAVTMRDALLLQLLPIFVLPRFDDDDDDDDSKKRVVFVDAMIADICVAVAVAATAAAAAEAFTLAEAAVLPSLSVMREEELNSL